MPSQSSKQKVDLHLPPENAERSEANFIVAGHGGKETADTCTQLLEPALCAEIKHHSVHTEHHPLAKSETVEDWRQAKSTPPTTPCGKREAEGERASHEG